MIRLICLDRDGTINEDNDYYLGIRDDWRKQVKFLEGVVEGLLKLNSVPENKLFIVTNQSGVAIAEPEFAKLDETRMHEVNCFILEKLRERGVKIEGYFACPYVDGEYVRRANKKGRKILPEYIQDGCRDLKPNIGLLEKCAKVLELSLSEVDLYVLGDRVSDVQLGLNGNGKGILVSSLKTCELGDEEKARRLQAENPERVFIAKDFLEAVSYVK